MADSADAKSIQSQKREAFIEELVAKHGEPTAEEQAWAHDIAANMAAAKAQAATTT